MDASQITIKQMAATLAHEVKNPISLVMACIDLLEAENPSENNGKTYKLMRRELGKVMNIMLDFIQITKPIETSGKDVNISALLKEVVSDCRELYRNKAEFEMKAVNEEYKIVGDESKLKRVFFNIYKNAAEALNDQGKVMTEVSHSGEFVVVKVIDNGTGITDEIRKKISTPFFTTKESGSGLGVFICKNIIADHGGVFDLDNAEPRGCVVTIKLPIERSDLSRSAER